MKRLDKDNLRDILNQLNDKDLVSFCSTDRSTRNFCNSDQTLWQKRTFMRYGKYLTPEELRKYKNGHSWSNYYIELSSKLNSKFPGYELAKAMDRNREDIVKLFRNLKNFKNEIQRIEEFDDFEKERYVFYLEAAPGSFPYNQGSYRAYYPSGQLKTEGDYFYGSKTGRWVEYWENGKIKEIMHYAIRGERELLHGKNLHYDPEGNLTHEFDYFEGSLF